MTDNLITLRKIRHICITHPNCYSCPFYLQETGWKYSGCLFDDSIAPDCWDSKILARLTNIKQEEKDNYD